MSGKPRWVWSAALMALAAVSVMKIQDWHFAHQPVTQYTQKLLLRSKHRHEQHEDLWEEPSIDDDFTRDETCRKYLVNFLNGTTDAKDECQGFYNAWRAADCTDDTHVRESVVAWYFILDLFGLGKRHRSENGTIVDDDVMIDDYYEAWECCSSIGDFYAKHCQQPELDAFKLFGVTAVLVICGFMKSFLRLMNLQWIPDAGACIFVGSIVGGFLRLIRPDVVKEKLTFDNDLFLQILLPPIVFEAAISINKRAFRRDIFPILTLAIFGTGFSALAIGYGTYHLSSWSNGMSLPLLDSLLFGALMSSIDPVATLSILAGVGVRQDDTIYTLVFGESLLNDGVAIVLFNSLVRRIGGDAEVDSAVIHDTIRDFCVVTIGSVVIGVFSGGLCSLYFWALRGKHTAVTEVAMFFTWALIPYYIADGLGLSGIISIMIMGFMLDYFVIGGFQSERSDWNEYIETRVHVGGPVQAESGLTRVRNAYTKAFSGKGHLLSASQLHVKFVAEVVANLMETAIFAYLGMFLFNDKSFDFQLIFSGLLSCVTSRAAMIVVTSLLINFCVFVDLEVWLGRFWYMLRRSHAQITLDDSLNSESGKVYLDRKTQLILFSAGVRGAVSYALVINLPVYDAVTKHGSNFKNELRAMTSATIVILLFCFGSLTYFIVQRDRDGVQQDDSLTDRLLSSETGSEAADFEQQPLTSMDVDTDAASSPETPPVARQGSA